MFLEQNWLIVNSAHHFGQLSSLFYQANDYSLCSWRHNLLHLSLIHACKTHFPIRKKMLSGQPLIWMKTRTVEFPIQHDFTIFLIVLTRMSRRWPAVEGQGTSARWSQVDHSSGWLHTLVLWYCMLTCIILEELHQLHTRFLWHLVYFWCCLMGHHSCLACRLPSDSFASLVGPSLLGLKTKISHFAPLFAPLTFASLLLYEGTFCLQDRCSPCGRSWHPQKCIEAWNFHCISWIHVLVLWSGGKLQPVLVLSSPSLIPWWCRCYWWWWCRCDWTGLSVFILLCVVSDLIKLTLFPHSFHCLCQ